MTVSCRYSARSRGSGVASGGSATSAPQVPQNRNDAGLAEPQEWQTPLNGLPQLPQNAMAAGFPAPHIGQAVRARGVVHAAPPMGAFFGGGCTLRQGRPYHRVLSGVSQEIRPGARGMRWLRGLAIGLLHVPPSPCCGAHLLAPLDRLWPRLPARRVRARGRTPSLLSPIARSGRAALPAPPRLSSRPCASAIRSGLPAVTAAPSLGGHRAGPGGPAARPMGGLDRSPAGRSLPRASSRRRHVGSESLSRAPLAAPVDLCPRVATIALVWLLGSWTLLATAYCLPWCLLGVHGTSA
jgi:hypothetical protein